MIPKDMVVHVSKEFSFSPQEIFNAWVDPTIIKKWLFTGEHSVIKKVDIDLRVGGKFSILERSQHTDINHFGKYFEIDRPFHLAFSLDGPLQFTGTTYVSVMIQPKSHGCELNLTQTGVSPEKTEASWIIMLHQLETILNDNKVFTNSRVEEPVEGYMYQQP